MRLRPAYRVLLIVFLVLGCFYPALFAEPLSVDDTRLLQRVINMGWDSVGSLFIPDGNRYYYRPLVIFSFFLDGRFFGLNNSFLHLENILFHLTTGLLLMTVLSRWCQDLAQERQWLPVVASLFFLLHPLVTEPVNWISGRTDLLAGLFVVAGMACVSGQSQRRPFILHLGASFCLLLGLFCKETAVMLLPAIGMGMVWRGTPLYVASWGQRLMRFSPYLAVTLIYFLLRNGGLFRVDRGLTSAALGAHAAVKVPLVEKLPGMVKAFGFYAGKVFWPLPLNFAIVEINRPLCWGLAIFALSALTIFVLRRRGPCSYWLCWGALFVAPSLLVAVQAMAWTPLAERYLYIPLIGVTMALAFLFSRWSARWLMMWALLLLPLSLVTVDRTILWQRNLTLFADVAEKSPHFSSGLNEYASALYLAGRENEAKRVYQKVIDLGEGSAKMLAQENLIKLFEAPVSGQSAEEELGQLAGKSLGLKQSLRILKTRITLVDTSLRKEQDPVKRRELLEQSLSLQRELSTYDNNPFIVYRIGQLLLALDQKEPAYNAFARVCRSSDDYYTPAACQLEKNLLDEFSKENSVHVKEEKR